MIKVIVDIHGGDKSPKELLPGVIKALDNPVASLQQDYEGTNIGMIAAWYKLNRAVLKALDNEEASVQQEGNG